MRKKTRYEKFTDYWLITTIIIFILSTSYLVVNDGFLKTINVITESIIEHVYSIILLTFILVYGVEKTVKKFEEEKDYKLSFWNKTMFLLIYIIFFSLVSFKFFYGVILSILIVEIILKIKLISLSKNIKNIPKR